MSELRKSIASAGMKGGPSVATAVQLQKIANALEAVETGIAEVKKQFSDEWASRHRPRPAVADDAARIVELEAELVRLKAGH